MAPSEPISPESCSLYPNVSDETSGSARGADDDGSVRGAGDDRAGERRRVRRRGEGANGVREEVAQESEEVIGEPNMEGSSERPQGMRMKVPPKAPTRDELRMHNATHTPFRSWCPKCVAGRAKRGGHSGAEDSWD